MCTVDMFQIFDVLLYLIGNINLMKVEILFRSFWPPFVACAQLPILYGIVSNISNLVEIFTYHKVHYVVQTLLKRAFVSTLNIVISQVEKWSHRATSGSIVLL